MAIFGRLFVVSALSSTAWLQFSWGQENATTCSPGTPGFAFDIVRESQQAVFTCSSTGKLKPEFQSDAVQVCQDHTCTQTTALSTLVPSATMANSGENYTLAFPKLPAAEKTFYLLCENKPSGGRRLSDSSPNPCILQFTVKVKPGKCPFVSLQITSSLQSLPYLPANFCLFLSLSDVQECKTKDQVLALQVGAPAGTVSFLCGGEFSTLDPTEATHVYKGSTCTESVTLTSIASGATRTSDTSTGVHTLTVPNLPSAEQQICYKCQKANKDSCNVVVTLKGASTVVTTKSPNSAGQTMASVFILVSLTFAGLVHVL